MNMMEIWGMAKTDHNIFNLTSDLRNNHIMVDVYESLFEFSFSLNGIYENFIVIPGSKI